MRRLVVPLLVVAQLAMVPIVPRPAAASAAAPASSDSRVGVVMMVVCGVSARIGIVVPVPWIGIAVVSCAAGLINAMLEPD